MEAFRKIVLYLASGSLIFASPFGLAQTFTVPNTFVPGTPATAADVNANFSATAAAINGKQNLVTGTCPTGQSIRAINANGSVVCQPLSFFGGDGSAGNLTVAVSQSWSATPPVNPNFANIVINSGQTLTVPAGTTIRCSGTFTNNGTLSVDPGATSDGAFLSALAQPGGPTMFLTSVAHPGDTPGPATLGMSHNNGVADPRALDGGTGGKAIPRAVAQTSFGNFRIGGGSGAGYDNQGNRGGGLVKIYCEGAIVNAGIINARGENGGNRTIAGGGGGIVVLASRTSVSNSAGTINVNGGNGDIAILWGANGGGGGGGIVVMISPTPPALGTVNVAGGTGGTGTASVTAGARTGGAGGGGSGGAGGDGGSVNAAATGTPTNGGDGGTGYSITMTLDPATIAR